MVIKEIEQISPTLVNKLLFFSNKKIIRTVKLKPDKAFGCGKVPYGRR